MNYTKLAFKGLLRRPAGFLAASLSIAIASIVLLLSLGFTNGYNNALTTSIDRLGANILAIPKGCPYEATGVILSGGQLRYAVAQDQLEPIKKTEGVATVSAVIMGARPVGPYDKVHVIIGTDENYFKLRPKLGITTPLKDDELAFGYKIATVVQGVVGAKNVEDIIGAEFKVGDRMLKIAYIASEESTEDEDVVFTKLSTAQTVLKAEGQLSSILISVDDQANTEIVAKRLMQIPDLQVVTIGDFQATISDFLSGARIAILSVLVIIMLISAVGILTTQASAVSEQKSEIGMMRAMGASKGQILWMTTLESIILAVIGAVVGVIVAILIGPTTSDLIKRALPQSPSGSIISFDALSVVITIIAVVLISILAAYAPSRSAASIKPTEAAQDE